MSDKLTIAGTSFDSRLFIGTSRYPNQQVMLDAIAASGAVVVTVSIRRVNPVGGGESLYDLLAGKVRILPNTAGCSTARDAVLTAQLARDALETDWIKLEVIGDEETLFPDVEHLVKAAQELVAENSNYYMPFQYGNEANPRAHYETTGEEIVRDLPEVDVFIAGLGTGGTLMGVGRRLREHNPSVKIVAVAPPPEDQIQGLRSLEEGFIPPILDLSMLDSRIMVESREAFYYTKELLEKEGIVAGISSGSVIACAERLASRMDRGNIVCLLADGGSKYLSTGLWSQSYKDIKKEVEGRIWW